MDKTICELFAGVGGFRLGLEQSSKDWKTVWMNQWEPNKKRQDAFLCYCSHFGATPNYVNQDICQIDKEEIPNHSLLVGGFPCQDYSVAKTGAKGIEGKKGVLWWEIEKILKIKRPPFILLENVDRLLKSPSKQRGRDFQIILTSLWRLGYIVEWRVINSAEYGFCQKRKRVFIFGFHESTQYAKKKHSISEGFFAKPFPCFFMGITREKKLISKNLLEAMNNESFLFENAGIMKDGIIYTVKTIPDYKGEKRNLIDVLERRVDKKYFLGEDLTKWQYLKGKKRIEKKAKNGHPYIYSEGAIAFPDDYRKPARTILTSEGMVNRTSHVVKDLDTGRLRILTPREVCRIQDFPSDWTEGMSERSQYFCMGNALVVGLVKKMGKMIADIIEQEK